MGDRNTLSYGFPSSSQPREQLYHCQRSRHQAFAGSLLKIRMGELGKAAIAIGSGALPARPDSFPLPPEELAPSNSAWSKVGGVLGRVQVEKQFQPHSV